MGKFTEGYKDGAATVNKEHEDDEEWVKNKVKELFSKSSYSECVEWYNGFYKALLDAELANVREAFKQAAEKTAEVQAEKRLT